MNTTPAKRASVLFVRAAVVLVLLAAVVFLFWYTSHPDSQASFYCALGDKGNCAIVAQEAQDRVVLSWAAFIAGFLAMVSAGAALVLRTL